MEALEAAIQWAIAHKPTASLQHKAAFANSVAYLVTGESGGFGGPSMRENLVSWMAADRIGVWTLEAAIKFCDPVCFGSVQKYKSQLREILRLEHCFDDDPIDLEAVAERLCLVCGVRLAPQAKHRYCKKHRGRSPHRKKLKTTKQEADNSSL